MDLQHAEPAANSGARPPSCRSASGRRGRAVQHADGITYLYKDATSGQFERLRPEEPAGRLEIATTTTDQGKTVPVHRPARERRAGPRHLRDRRARREPGAWNHKLLTTSAPHRARTTRSRSPSAVLDDMALSRGFMVANNGLQIHGENTNQTRLDRVVHDAQGAHHRALRADPLHDGRGLLGRVLPVDGRGDVPGAARRAPAQLQVHRPVDDGVRRLRLRPARPATSRPAPGGHAAGCRRSTGTRTRATARPGTRCSTATATRRTPATASSPTSRSTTRRPTRRRALHDRRTTMRSIFGRRPQSQWRPVGEEDRPRVRQPAVGQRGGRSTACRRCRSGQITPARVRRPQRRRSAA